MFITQIIINQSPDTISKAFGSSITHLKWTIPDFHKADIQTLATALSSGYQRLEYELKNQGLGQKLFVWAAYSWAMGHYRNPKNALERCQQLHVAFKMQSNLEVRAEANRAFASISAYLQQEIHDWRF